MDINISASLSSIKSISKKHLLNASDILETILSL